MLIWENVHAAVYMRPPYTIEIQPDSRQYLENLSVPVRKQLLLELQGLAEKPYQYRGVPQPFTGLFRHSMRLQGTRYDILYYIDKGDKQIVVFGIEA